MASLVVPPFRVRERRVMVDYYEDDDFDFGALPEVQQQEFLYDLIGFAGVPQDTEARNMFWSVMYDNELTLDERIEAYQRLSDYLEDEYGLVFADVWDWEDFRNWYDNQ